MFWAGVPSQDVCRMEWSSKVTACRHGAGRCIRRYGLLNLSTYPLLLLIILLIAEVETPNSRATITIGIPWISTNNRANAVIISYPNRFQDMQEESVYIDQLVRKLIDRGFLAYDAEKNRPYLDGWLDA